MTGRDVLGIAQTGTGKTASFVLPMICRLETGRARARMPRSLILAPTRELAAQVAQSFEKYGVNHKLNLALLIGGVSMDDQVKKLDRGVDVLIATPGRLLDHFQRGRIMLMGVEILVIDEADRMLDMGFIPDIEKICKLLPPRRQTLFFSATMPPEITRLVSQFLKDPERIEAAPPATTAKTITQRFMFCPNGEDWAKRETLRELIASQNVKNAIIFCNRKVEVAILHKSLRQARLLGRRIARRHGPEGAHGDARQVPRRRAHAACRERRRRPRSRHPRRQPHLQLRLAVAARRLRAPHRSHGPRRQGGHARLSLVTLDELKSLQGHREDAGRARRLDRRRDRPRKTSPKAARSAAGAVAAPAPSAGVDAGRPHRRAAATRAGATSTGCTVARPSSGQKDAPSVQSALLSHAGRTPAGRKQPRSGRTHSSRKSRAGRKRKLRGPRARSSLGASNRGRSSRSQESRRQEGQRTRTQAGASRRAQAAAASPSRSRQRPWPSAPSRASAAAAARSRRGPAAAGTRGLCRQRPGLPAQARQAPGQGRERVAAASGLG